MPLSAGYPCTMTWGLSAPGWGVCTMRSPGPHISPDLPGPPGTLVVGDSHAPHAPQGSAWAAAVQWRAAARAHRLRYGGEPDLEPAGEAPLFPPGPQSHGAS